MNPGVVTALSNSNTMSQSFAFINETRQEYYAPTNSSTKAKDRVTDALGTGAVAYLMLDGPQDGTAFIDQCFTVEGGDDDRPAVDPGARLQISEANEYAGRWAGDTIRLAGDYRDGDWLSPGTSNGDGTDSDWVDITTGVEREFEAFAWSDWVDEQTSVWREV